MSDKVVDEIQSKLKKLSTAKDVKYCLSMSAKIWRKEIKHLLRKGYDPGYIAEKIQSELAASSRNYSINQVLRLVVNPILKSLTEETNRRRLAGLRRYGKAGAIADKIQRKEVRNKLPGIDRINRKPSSFGNIREKNKKVTSSSSLGFSGIRSPGLRQEEDL